MIPPQQPHRSPSRLASALNAARGLRVLLSQPNARIHLVAAILVIALGWKLAITRSEWLAVTLAMALVITAEALNTAIEYAVDLVSPQWQPLARDIKDVAAAAVLVSSLGATAVGLLVFIPYL
jgi:diacylglycerol kinase (ATP)